MATIQEAPSVCLRLTFRKRVYVWRVSPEVSAAKLAKRIGMTLGIAPPKQLVVGDHQATLQDIVTSTRDVNATVPGKFVSVHVSSDESSPRRKIYLPSPFDLRDVKQTLFASYDLAIPEPEVFVVKGTIKEEVRSPQQIADAIDEGRELFANTAGCRPQDYLEVPIRSIIDLVGIMLQTVPGAVSLVGKSRQVAGTTFMDALGDALREETFDWKTLQQVLEPTQLQGEMFKEAAKTSKDASAHVIHVNVNTPFPDSLPPTPLQALKVFQPAARTMTAEEAMVVKFCVGLYNVLVGQLNVVPQVALIAVEMQRLAARAGTHWEDYPQQLRKRPLEKIYRHIVMRDSSLWPRLDPLEAVKDLAERKRVSAKMKASRKVLQGLAPEASLTGKRKRGQ